MIMPCAHAVGEDVRPMIMPPRSAASAALLLVPSRRLPPLVGLISALVLGSVLWFVLHEAVRHLIGSLLS